MGLKRKAVWCVAGFAIAAGAAWGQADLYHEGWTDLNKNGEKDVYEDASQPIEARVEDLLGQMTTEEKTMQLVTLYGWKRVLQDPLPTPEWDNEIWKDGLGNIDEHINGNRYRGLDWPPATHVDTLNAVQRWFIENTRLGIPVDFTEEGIRGLAHTKATCFPNQLGIGATWNRDLARNVGRITGAEGLALGYSQIYSPIMDVPRDPRWGRTVECYSESPFLVTELAIQQALGLTESGIGISPKHFCVYSIPNRGSPPQNPHPRSCLLSLPNPTQGPAMNPSSPLIILHRQLPPPSTHRSTPLPADTFPSPSPPSADPSLTTLHTHSRASAPPLPLATTSIHRNTPPTP